MMYPPVPKSYMIFITVYTGICSRNSRILLLSVKNDTTDKANNC